MCSSTSLTIRETETLMSKELYILINMVFIINDRYGVLYTNDRYGRLPVVDSCE